MTQHSFVTSRWLINSPDLAVLSAMDLSRLICTLHGTEHAECFSFLILSTVVWRTYQQKYIKILLSYDM